MASFSEGERVRIRTREQTDEDVKSAMYYPFYGGLTGLVHKVYTKDEVAIEVEPESLTIEVRSRHEDVRNQMKTKWLDSLSEEGRSKLSERDKNFHLRYVLLVSSKDLERAAKASVEAGEKEDPAIPRKTLAEIEAAEEAELARRAQG